MCNPYVTSPENLREWSLANREQPAALDARLQREAGQYQVRQWVEAQGIGE